jgi:small subunit ribosomal protein S20
LANIRSQIKRNKQNEKRRAQNAQVKSSVRTASKRVEKAVQTKENPDSIKGLFVKFIKTIDKAAGSGVIPKKRAARKKSRIAKRVNALLKGQS